MIWKRTIASQMADARLATTTVRLGAGASDGRDVEFSASGTVTLFAGFLAAYEEGTDEVRDSDGGSEGGGRAADRRLPAMREGDALGCSELHAEGHTTTPPARYTEASLVKDLEERGIGRPSTYAAIIATIVDRGYVRKKGTSLIPTFLAFSVTRLMEQHFAALVDYNFTARLEEILDLVANSSTDRLRVLEGFFYGDPDPRLPRPGPRWSRAWATSTPARWPRSRSARTGCPNAVTGAPDEVRLRVGESRPYVERGEEKGNVAEDVAPDELDLAMAEALLAAPSGDGVLGRHRGRGWTSWPVRSVRAVRDRGPARGRPEVGQAAAGLAAERDVLGHPDAR